MSELRDGWYAVAESRELKGRPLRRLLNGIPLVIWRTKDGVGALPNRCPHRGAPLSSGKVVGGAIACPYHGWRFDAGGGCVATPALPDRVLSVPVQAFAAAEADGLIFVRWGQGGGAAPDLPPLTPYRTGESRLRGEVMTTLADVAENILDTTHTGIVHENVLRKPEGRRLTPKVIATADAIEAHYPPQATPSGLVGRLIGGPRYRIVDRFRAPSIAEVEYWDDEALAFAIRFHLAPSRPGRVAIFVRMAVAPSWLAAVKRAALMAFFHRIFGEDRVVLEEISRNRAEFPASGVIYAPQDLLRRGIEAILRGETPEMVRQPPDILV